METNVRKYEYLPSEKMPNLRALVERAVQKFPDKVAYRDIISKEKIVEHGYKDLLNDMNSLGTAMIDLGMEGYHVALLGESSYMWVVNYLTIINGVGVVVPIDKELQDDDVALQLNKADVDAIVCSRAYVGMMERILPRCPRLKRVVIMNAKTEHDSFLSMPELVGRGAELIFSGDRRYIEKKIDTEALAQIVFTSGTTGANKGVMLCQRNLTHALYGAFSLIRTQGTNISVLPMHHTFECTCHLLGSIYGGTTLCFNDSLRRVTDNLVRFQPDMSLMVPLFLESMYNKIFIEAKKNGLLAHIVYGIKFSNLLRKFGLDKREKYFQPILSKFGGNLNQVVCGGAPIRQELIDFFDSIGINVVNGYGITECAPLISANCTYWKVKNSVGKVIPGMEVRIVDPDETGNGEIQVKGDNVMMGYYKDEESTRATFTEDGWFKTGDLGRVDKHKMLYLSGRLKNLIILDNGKNVSPEELEEHVMISLPYVGEIMVYASDMDFPGKQAICASIYVPAENYEKAGVAAGDLEALKAKVEADIRKMNSHAPAYKRISGITIREREFEKTTTKKIKRHMNIERGKTDVKLN